MNNIYIDAIGSASTTHTTVFAPITATKSATNTSVTNTTKARETTTTADASTNTPSASATTAPKQPSKYALHSS